MRLQNKVAVVTGGGGGIGAAICRAFAAEGAHVAVTDLRPEAAEQVAAEIRATGGQADAWGLNVAERATVERAADEIAARLGPVDIWVNNAGISRVMPFMECTDDLWDRSPAHQPEGHVHRLPGGAAPDAAPRAAG